MNIVHPLPWTLERTEHAAPFFSVCTDVCNRARTIRRTIASIAGQTYRRFEYIIINNRSDDESDMEIRRALAELPLHDVTVTYETTERRIAEIENWNSPLRLARGRYAVFCEGDDWFSPTHLQEAARVLADRDDIGLYVSGRGDLDVRVNAMRYKELDGIVAAPILLRSRMSFTFVPPPSEMIFRRIGSDGLPLFYDADRFEYAAEYGLYAALLKQGWSGCINTAARTVFRSPPSYRVAFARLHDAYTALDLWRNAYETDAAYRDARMLLLRRAARMLASQIVWRSLEWPLVRHVVREARMLRTWMPLQTLPGDVLTTARHHLKLRLSRGH